MIAEWLGAILELNAESYRSGLEMGFEALEVEVDRKSLSPFGWNCGRGVLVLERLVEEGLGGVGGGTG